MVKAIRRFFDERGFTEMITPRLVGFPGQEPYLEPLWTAVQRAPSALPAPALPAALITSPEYAMKRLLASGLDCLYDLGPCFRNGEPWDGAHDVEFLLLEWYRRNAGLNEIIKDTEAMVRFVFSSVGSTRCALPSTPFRCVTVKEAMKKYADIDLDDMIDHPERLREKVVERGYTATADDTWDDLFFKIFLSEVEPKIGWRDPSMREPTFLTHYPASMAALARRDPEDPRYALRTELYIGDLELANGFAELADPVEQRKRFEEERDVRRRLGKRTWDLDERLLQALPAMGNAAGMAFGVDRLAMLIGGTTLISDMLPIPAQERFADEKY